MEFAREQSEARGISSQLSECEFGCVSVKISGAGDVGLGSVVVEGE